MRRAWVHINTAGEGAQGYSAAESLPYKYRAAQKAGNGAFRHVHIAYRALFVLPRNGAAPWPPALLQRHVPSELKSLRGATLEFLQSKSQKGPLVKTSFCVVEPS